MGQLSHARSGAPHNAGFKIKYQFKNNRLKVYTLGEHSNGNEIRKRGLKLDQASKLVEAVEVVPTRKQCVQFI